MTTLVAACLALMLAYTGMTGLCLAMNRHASQVWGKAARPRWLAPCLRAAGWLLLALTLLPCLWHWGGSIGPVIWLGFLSAAALLVVWLLAYRPGWIIKTAVAALLAVPAILLL